MDKVFIEQVEQRLNEMSDVPVKAHRVERINGVVKLGFEFRAPDDEVAPVIYLAESDDLQSVESVANLLYDRYKNLPDVELTGVEILQSRELVLKHVRRFLCSKELNTDFLSKVPHTEFADLAVYYRIIVNEDEGVASVVVSNELAEKWSLTLDELDAASEQNQRAVNYVTLRAADLLAELKDILCFEDDIVEFTQLPMYVITTENRLNGSSALLSSIIFKGLSSILEDDLYILPSSINELLVLPKGSADIKTLEGMVLATNLQCVSPDEVLSNSVYSYSRKTGQVTKA